MLIVAYDYGCSRNSRSAKTALNALFSADADYVVKGSFGTKTANVEAGADARDVAKAFNLISGTTGVQANVVTRAKISAITGADTYSFTLQGKSTTSSTVNATIASTSNLTELKDAINAVSGSTGITAALTEDLAGINLVQNEGYDIIIGDVTAATTNTAISFDTSSPPASCAGATLTSGAAHGLSVGDVVKYTKGGTVVTGLTDGAFYKVASVASTNYNDTYDN